MKREHEDKKLGSAEIETKDETAIDATTCPERRDHATRLGRVCAGCDELIPPGGYYNAEQYRRYFGGPIVELPPHPFAPGEDNARLWREYDALRQLREDALFAWNDAKEGRRQIRRSSRFVDHTGNVVEDPNVHLRGAVATTTADEAGEEFRRIDAATAAKLKDIRKEEATRGARARAAVLAESYPPPGQNLLDRVGAVLRGGSA